MMEIFVIFVIATLFSTLLLRKVLISSAAFTNNAASFVNQTADRLHVRKLVGRAMPNGANAVGDLARSSFDEVPVDQSTTNDSRSHIASISQVTNGGTGAIAPGPSNNIVLTFERGQLFLDPDEAFFINNTDIVGNPNVRFNWNVWYED